MTNEEFAAHLRSFSALEPSADLTARVMEAIRSDTGDCRGHFRRFPMWISAAAAVVILLGGILIGRNMSAARAQSPEIAWIALTQLSDGSWASERFPEAATALAIIALDNADSQRFASQIARGRAALASMEAHRQTDGRSRYIQALVASALDPKTFACAPKNIEKFLASEAASRALDARFVSALRSAHFANLRGAAN